MFLLLILDASRELNQEDYTLMIKYRKLNPLFAVWNKLNSPSPFLAFSSFSASRKVSAKQGTGIETLRSKIDAVIWEKGPPSHDEIIITNIRHKEALVLASQFCRHVIKGLREGLSPEFLSF